MRLNRHLDRVYRGDHDARHLNYLMSGKATIEELRPIVNAVFGGFDQIGAFLEFACGHGRLTRFLVQEMPASRIFVSDIYQDAVEFQKEQFGVNGKVSVSEPEKYPLDQTYDCILVASLFSHLPPRTFVRGHGFTFYGNPISLPLARARLPARLFRNNSGNCGKRNHGDQAPGFSPLGRPVSPRVLRHQGRD